jgi:hypothetical protein
VQFNCPLSESLYGPRFGRCFAAGCAENDSPWVERGTNGFRLFTGGSTAAFHPGTLDDPRSFPSWQLIGDPLRLLAGRESAGRQNVMA